jgi:two-component system, response regulator
MADHQEADILLVEDSATDAQLIELALERQGIVQRPLWVQDGVEALDYLFRKGVYAQWPATLQPKLVMLDLKLPRMDGIQVLERIKVDARTREIPVVMMSSSAEEVDLHAAYQRSVNSYIVKPLEFAEFLKVVGEVGAYWLLANKLPSYRPC